MTKHLIVNADDFGASYGVNRGIIDCHIKGIVTSASLMVTGSAVTEAVSMSRDNPSLSVGLHWDICGEDEREFDTGNLAAVREEIEKQLETFVNLMDKMPTHLDSHRHAHRENHLMPIFSEILTPLGIPIRFNGRVRYVGGFYAQWEWKVTNLKYVGVHFLQQLLREEVKDGWTEISCHPGYVTSDYHAVYLHEREEEIKTLTNPQLKQIIKDLGITLVSYADYNSLHKSSTGSS